MAVPVLHRDTHHARQAPDGEPMRELDQIQQETFQLLQSMLGASPFAGVGTWVPAVDIEETEDSWILEAELPGAKSDDIDIEAHDNEIQITGEIVEKERAGILRRRTRRVGRFDEGMELRHSRGLWLFCGPTAALRGRARSSRSLRRCRGTGTRARRGPRRGSWEPWRRQAGTGRE